MDRAGNQLPRPISAIVAAAALASPGAHASKPVVAVFDIRDSESTPEAIEVFSDYVATKMTASGGFQLVPRGDLKARLAQQKAASYRACYDDACQLEIGKELAAEAVLSTRISRIDDHCIVTMKLFDLRAATAIAAGTAEGPCSTVSMLGLLGAACNQIGGSRGAKRDLRSVQIYGVTFLPLTVDDKDRLGIAYGIRGIRVGDVEPGVFQAAGLVEKDVVTGVSFIVPGRQAERWRLETLNDLDRLGLDSGTLGRCRRSNCMFKFTIVRRRQTRSLRVDFKGAAVKPRDKAGPVSRKGKRRALEATQSASDR